MTVTTAEPVTDRLPERAEPAGRPWATTARCAATLTAAAAAGAAALVVAYRRAEWEQGGQFGWFWAGMLVFTLPAAFWAVRRGTGARLRLAVLVAYACFTYLPKLLRNPAGPLYHDEYAHWGQSHDILLDGRLFEQNPIVRVIGDYPGLHATVASLASLTGLTVWHAALIVLIIAHLLLVLGVAALAGQLWPDPRIGAAAAIVYSLNSSFLFFDTQLGYESLAIGVLVWALVAALRAMRAAPAGWSALVLVLAVAITATHHLTALWLIGILGLLAVTCTAGALRDRALARPARVAWALTGGAGLIVAVWMGAVSPRTDNYLNPYLGRALGQFSGLAGGDGSGSRTLFNQSIAPWWEQQSAFAAPGVALVFMTGATLLWWRRRRRAEPLTRAGAGAMLLVGALYFPATLLILTPSGAEGARRSWAFSYLGIAVVVAPLIIALLDRAPRRFPHSPQDTSTVVNGGALDATDHHATADTGGVVNGGAPGAADHHATADTGGVVNGGAPGAADHHAIADAGGVVNGGAPGATDHHATADAGGVVGTSHHATGGGRRGRSVVVGGVLLAIGALMLVGNNAAGMNPSYRFPGPPVFGSDTRAATPEVLAAAAWLRETQGREARLVADRYSGLIFGSYGEQEPTTGSETFPTYDLYLTRPGRPFPAALLEQLRSWRFEFLIVDRRMSVQVPDIRIYFETNEPIPHDGRPAFSREQLTKFDHLPWLIKLYDGPHIAIYRFDFDRLGLATRGSVR